VLSTFIHESMATYPTEPGNGAVYRKVRTWVSSGEKGLSAVRVVYTAPLLTLMIGVALLMLIICANVANLLLARAVARGREMSVRLAIGARRARLVRQLLTESLVLGVLSAASGLVLAWWGSRAILVLAADGATAISLDTHLDLPVLGFTVGVTILAVVLFGLAPALRATRIDLAAAMRAHARSLTGAGGAGRFRLPAGKLLVAGQVGLSLVLLVGATLLARSLQRVEGVDTGLDRDHLLIVGVDALDKGYRGDRLAALIADLSGRFARVHGVAAVSWSQNGIFTGSDGTAALKVPGFSSKDPADSNVHYDFVGAGYVRAIGGRLLRGRDITEQDIEHTPSVAVVNETMARFYFGTLDALGKRIYFDDTTVTTIVGVIADVRDHNLTQPVPRRAYAPYAQQLTGNDQPDQLVFEVRSTGEPAAIAAGIRKAIVAADPSLPIAGIVPLSQAMHVSVRQERLLARLASGFGVLALLLASLGLYGVMTYAISRRTGEFGLRVALGAQRGDVIRLVFRDALTVVASGVAVGVPLALASTRLLRSQLHGMDAADPASMALALGVLAASAIVAALIPSLRAARVEPLEALREE
jgi:predicted permease